MATSYSRQMASITQVSRRQSESRPHLYTYIAIFNVQVCLEENYYLVLHFHDKATSIQIEEELNTKRSYTYVVADICGRVCGVILYLIFEPQHQCCIIPSKRIIPEYYKKNEN